ncbi:ABC transporter permease [Paracoccus mutanolyticus]|uniref:ABC transporter permease n=1 Tax=Paracoccus mutanolyticus TaxID=1499308 RepID=UPI001CB9D639|nr:ABC transporter permease [Paracoccus mutanolyticus]
MKGWTTAFGGIVRREFLRFTRQRERFLAALVRPLVWLFIFAAGFRSVLGLSITPPYRTYVLYEVYVTPGLCGMILLFSGMQSSLSMVYDRETGAMRSLLVSPYPRWFLLGSKLVASVMVAVMQVYAFLLIAWLWGIRPPWHGYLTVLPALVLAGVMCHRKLAILRRFRRLLEISMATDWMMSHIKGLSLPRPCFVRCGVARPAPFSEICALNPFTHAVGLIRFALYGQVEPVSLAVTLGCILVFFGGTVFMYDPAKGLWRGRKGGV